jgi:hypothetical protein
MGCPRILRSVDIFESNAKGYVIEHDVSAESLRIFQTRAVAGNAAANSLVELVAGSDTVPTVVIEADCEGY